MEDYFSLTESPDRNEYLHKQISDLQYLYENEQEQVIKLRKELNEVETRELTKTSEYNEKLSEIAADAARAWACVEKGEAKFREIELNYVRSQKQAAVNENQKNENELEIRKSLINKIDVLSKQITELEKQNANGKTLAASKMESLQKEVTEKSEKIFVLKRENETLMVSITNTNQQKDLAISELKARINNLQDATKTLTDDQKRTQTEIDFIVATDTHLKQDYQVATERIKSLEQSLEVERSGHLQTKFNSELLQLQVKDLEGSVSMEKCAKSEASKAVDRVNLQMQELERLHEGDKKRLRDTKETLLKCEKEKENLKTMLASELSDKKKLVKTFSTQVEEHTKHFNQMKEELAKVRKKLVAIETNYSGNLNEIELLVDNFSSTTQDNTNLDDNTSNNAIPKRKIKSSKVMLNNTHSNKLIGSLRTTLMDYKKQTTSSKIEMQKATSKSHNMFKELQTVKQQLSQKEHELDDLKNTHTKTCKDLKTLQKDFAKQNKLVTNMATELKTSTDSESKEKSGARRLADALEQQSKRTTSDNQDKLVFLTSLYDRLTSILPNPVSPSHNDFTWHDICSDISEHVTRVNHHLSSVQQVIDEVKYELTKKEQDILQIKQEHENEIFRLKSEATQKETELQRQKSNWEQKYTKLVSTNLSRSKHLDVSETWRKHERETELLELNTRLSQLTSDNASLLSACMLLSGAYFNLKSQQSNLTTQRRILLNCLDKWCTFKSQLQSLVVTLENELGDEPACTNNRHFLLRFRVAVIAVIAANRLNHFRHTSQKICLLRNGVYRHGHVAVLCGLINRRKDSFVGLKSNKTVRSPCVSNPGKCIYDWLSSRDMQAAILTSMMELQTVMASSNLQATQADYSSIVSATASSFQRLIERISSHFSIHNERPLSASLSRKGLVYHLASGLAVISNSLTIDQKRDICTLQETTEAVQRYLLDLTRRLEVSEESRRCAASQAEQLSLVKHDLSNSQRHVTELQQNLRTLVHQNPSGKSVELSKYQDVCNELRQALEREKKLSKMMAAKTNLDQEDILQQSNIESENVKHERDQLLLKLRDAERALDTAALDKKTLSAYMISIINVLKDYEVDVSPPLPEVLLQSNVTHTKHAGPELTSCQEMVHNFGGLVQQCLHKLNDKQEEIISLRQKLSDLLLKAYGAGASSDQGIKKVYSQDSLSTFASLRSNSECSYTTSQNTKVNRDTSPNLSSHIFSVRPHTTDAS